MGLILPFIRGIPWWVWLVAVSTIWGGIQHKRASWAAAREKQTISAAAQAEAQALRESLQETERRMKAHQEIANAAQAQAETNARAAAAARAAADRVRSAAASYAASAASSPAGGQCKAAEDTALLFAELLGRATNRAAELADLADKARTAGQACEASYDKLK